MPCQPFLSALPCFALLCLALLLHLCAIPVVAPVLPPPHTPLFLPHNSLGACALYGLGLDSYTPYFSSCRHEKSKSHNILSPTLHCTMATEAMSPSSPPPVSGQKISRYRSVRRAQEQHTDHARQFAQHEEPLPAVSTVPAVPAVPDSHAQNNAPLSRSMSRYHRRPATSHVTKSQPPPIRSNTTFDAASPVSPQSPPSTSSNDAPNSPPQRLHVANTAQRRPRTAGPCAEPAYTDNDASRQQSLSGDDSAKEILHKEKERQRQMKEKYDAKARARRQARQAELDRAEKMRHEAEHAARLLQQQQQQQREFEEAEALRRQRAEAKRAELEHGRRLQKTESRKTSRSREDDTQRAKQEERQRQAVLAKLEERTQKPPSSPAAVSPPRQQEVGFGMFKRRKDEALGLDAPAQVSAPPQLNLSFSNREEETIRPGGGGVVLGIDAPTSAVNAGDRVRLMLPPPPPPRAGQSAG